MMKYPQRLLDVMEKKEPRKPNTYCMEIVDGVRCCAVIPVTERLCAACKKRKEDE